MLKSLQSCLTLCNPRTMDLQAPPGKNSGVGRSFLLQGIFLTQGSNPHFWHLLHWQGGHLPLRKPQEVNLQRAYEQLAYSTPEYLLKRREYVSSKNKQWNLVKNVHNSLIHDSQTQETAQVSINKRMDKQTMEYYSAIKKKQTTDTHNNMDESQTC